MTTRERSPRRPARFAFRVALVAGLVWSAYPTVADALDATNPGRRADDAPVAAAPVPITLPPPTTVPPTAPPPASEPPAAGPAPTEAAATVSAALFSGVCDAAGDATIDAMNRDRAANGVPPLCANAWLGSLAQSWAEQLARDGTFVHRDLWTVIGGSGFQAMAENMLRGSAALDPTTMEAAWMASPEHAINLLNGTYQAAGVGIAYSGDRVYVVVDFGG